MEQQKKKKGKRLDENELRTVRSRYVNGDKSYQGDHTGWQLEQTDEKNYKVFEFANYPVTSDFKPRNGVYRMSLPCDADWSGKEDPEMKAERERLKLEQAEKLKKLIAQRQREEEERRIEREEEEKRA